MASALAVMEGLPILLVAGGSEPLAMAQRMGAYGYLRKPFRIEALIQAVREGLTQ